MFFQFFTIAGTCVAAVKITLEKSTGIFVMTGKNRQDIIDKAFAELNNKLLNPATEKCLAESESIPSPYVFA